MNRVIGFTIYEARIETETLNFSMDFLASSVPEAYLKLEFFGIPQEQIVDLFPAQPRSDHHDPQCLRPYPTCEVR